MSKERLALGEETTCATRVVKEAVRLFGSVTGVPVTKSLIACSRKAHADYVLHLEKEKTAKKLKLTGFSATWKTWKSLEFVRPGKSLEKAWNFIRTPGI